MACRVSLYCEQLADTFSLLEWAKLYCQSYITNDVVIDPVYFQPVCSYYFSDEKDAALFVLKWGGRCS